MQRQISVARNDEKIFINDISTLVRGDKLIIKGHGKMIYAGNASNNGQLIFLTQDSPKKRFAIGVDRKFATKGTKKELVLTHRYELGGGESNLYKEGIKMLEAED